MSFKVLTFFFHLKNSRRFIPPLKKGCHPLIKPETGSETSRKILFALLFPLFFVSCESDALFDPIPYVLVDETINLMNQEYLPLRQDGGFVEILGGYRGILIYRENATTYRAFERASPHRVDEACAVIFVDPSGFFLKEGCDNTVYDFQGIPIGGVSPLPLRQYGTQLDGNFLYIFNLQ
ncbi:MAG: hypothetical protein ACFB15_05405 [Cyclobacteriaceae bacterium]